MVFLIKSFHEGMQAEISVGDSIAQVVISNGLRQRRVLAHTFSLICDLVLM